MTINIEKRKAEYKAKQKIAEANKENRLKNRVFMLNLQAELMSGCAAVMRPSLEDTPPKFKSDHTLYKNTKQQLEALLTEITDFLSKDLVSGFGLRAFIQSDEFNIKIKVSSFYPVENGCVYLDDYVYLYARNDANLPEYPLQFITLNECKEAIEKRKEIAKQVEALTKESRELAHKYTLVG